MATKKQKSDAVQDFAKDLIQDINKDFKGKRVAYNLASDISPTHVKQWVSTGSRQLDYAISNIPNGGMPSGRIVEIFGMPSIGKSHIAAQICISAQKMGGLSILIDAENATNPENLQNLGVDISKRFVYIDTNCTEEILDIAEKTMIRARELSSDAPIVIIWDSVAASSPKAELEADYDKESMGLQARAISKGMRKITGVIGENNVLFVCINQMRQKMVTNPYQDPWCVDPKTTIANFRLLNHKYKNIAADIFQKDVDYRFRNSFHDLARFIDAVKGTNIVETYQNERYLKKVNDPNFMDDINEPLLVVDCGGLIEIDTPSGYKAIKSFLVKKPVPVHFLIEDNNFRASGAHKVQYNAKWLMMCEHPNAVRIEQPLEIVDIEVADSVYTANRLVHHNTTPGGQAIPFHASVRIRLDSGKQILNKNNEPVGIKVIATVKKNKVSAPFRKAEFEIHFGKGIVEHEQILDELRRAGKQTFEDGTSVEISGTAQWKTLTAVDSKGKDIVEPKKFQKAGFAELLDDPTYKPWVDKLFDAVYIRKYTKDELLTDGDSPDSEEDE